MPSLKNIFKKTARAFIDVFLLIYGLTYFWLSKNKPLNERTPIKSHLSMIRLFCLTSGWSNDIISNCISFFDKPISLQNNDGILGDLSDIQIKEISNKIETDGYYIFENKLPKEIIERLYKFASTHECLPRPLDEEPLHKQPKILFDRNNPKSSVYDIPSDISIENLDVQDILSDHSILAVAQSYLKASPKTEPVAFWWSAPFSNKPQSNSAQQFHFDMDRFKWIKFFIFLTDVTIENGPHVFVSKSHRTKGIPRSLLNAGYSRLSDEQIRTIYPNDAIKTFTVPAGTILAEDTRGLHKGTNLIKGERLVLELQFSNSLFGAASPCIQKAQIKGSKFLTFARKHQKIFKLYPI